MNVLASEGIPERPENPPTPFDDPKITPPDIEVEVPTIVPVTGLRIEKDIAKVYRLGEELAPENGRYRLKMNDLVVYSLKVTNPGDLDLIDVLVTDELTQFETTIPLLKAGETVELETNYVVTLEDVKAKTVLNIAVATAEDPMDPDVPLTSEDEEETPVDPPKMGLEVVKTEVSKSQKPKGYRLGEKVVFKIVATNTGEYDLSDVLVVDELVNFTDTIPVLKVGESKEFTVEYIVTEEDVEAGHVLNIVTVKADNPIFPEEPPVEDDSSTDVPTDEPVYGSVKVRYLTEDGKVLREWEFVVVDGEVGDDYKTLLLEFSGYEFSTMSKDSAAREGKVVEGVTIVEYVYKVKTPPTPPTPPTPTQPESPTMGDTSDMALPIVLFAISALGILGLGAFYFRKKEEDI